MIKLKKLIKESAWDRKFGEPLPTVKDYKEAYDKKNGKLNEAKGSYKGVFEYDAEDPFIACRSFVELFMLDGTGCGYSESWDTYGWNDDKNWQKAVDEFHKEMFKIVDEYVKAQKNAYKFEPKKNKIFKKWRKTDGSKAGD